MDNRDGWSASLDASPAPLAGGDGAPRVPQAIAQQAVQWWLELQTKNTAPARRAAWQQWRAADPVHETAWQRIETVSGQLAGISLPLAKAALAGPQSLRKRRTVQLLTALVVVGSSATLVRRSQPWQSWAADETTATGERRTLQLPDGGTLQLNTASAVNIQFSAERRVVQLVRGEVLVQTAKDPAQRPFVVQTAMGGVRAIGTRFTVRQHDAFVSVGVLQGTVELQPVDAPASIRLLHAGEQGRLTGFDTQATGQMDDGAGAWADGMLVVSHMRLDDFLAELGRYSLNPLSCDPAVAGLRVSGSYPLADIDKILDTLSATLGLQVETVTRFWGRQVVRVSLAPRSKPA